MNVLVTGANGFLGRHVVGALLRRGHGVRALIRPTAEFRCSEGDRVEIVRADLRAPGDLAPAFEGVDVLVHLAAAVTGSDHAQLAAAVVGTERLLEGFAHSATRRVVLASSFSVYDWSEARGTLSEDSPLEPASDLYERDGYAVAKRWQERVARRIIAGLGRELTIVRPGFIWGPGHEDLACAGQRVGPCYVVFGPTRVLPLTYVENCAELFVNAAESALAAGQTFNAVDGHEVTAWRYASDHLVRSGSPGLRLPVPYVLAMAGVRTVQQLSRWAFRGKGKLPGLLVPCRFEARFKPLRFSNHKACEVLGWNPRFTYSEALERTYSAPPPGVVAATRAEPALSPSVATT